MVDAREHSGRQAMVSVIMPVYNGEKYLEQSIESVIQQTYKDWKLIIVNDCSGCWKKLCIDNSGTVKTMEFQYFTGLKL